MSDMPALAATSDSEIRLALHRRRLNRQKRQSNTLVIDELGLAHAQSRIDIAVINGCVHGYEIKSGQDDLVRLETQFSVYRRTLQKLTFVADSKHFQSIVKFVPEWCGIIEVERGPRGGIHLTAIRPARLNPDVEPAMLAHLLWRPEAVALLERHGYPAKELRQPRKQLYELLSEALTPREITAAIREFMPRRRAWRDRPAHV